MSPMDGTDTTTHYWSVIMSGSPRSRNHPVPPRPSCKPRLEVLESRNLLDASATLADLTTATTLYIEDVVGGNAADAQVELSRIINDFKSLIGQVPAPTITTTFSSALTSAIEAAVQNLLSGVTFTGFVHTPVQPPPLPPLPPLPMVGMHHQ
jgi:hypothetical protein